MPPPPPDEDDDGRDEQEPRRQLGGEREADALVARRLADRGEHQGGAEEQHERPEDGVAVHAGGR
jgi:hypothetical protein